MKNIRNRKKIIRMICIVILGSTILLLVILLINNKNNLNENENNKNSYVESGKKHSRTNVNDINYKKEISINEIKEEQGLIADSKLYQIDTEYDGRKILNIKSDIQYKVAFAGIIKQQIPSIQEIDSILNENYPKQNGVWIEKKDRKKVLELLKGNTNSLYSINESGYLIIENNEQQNDYDKKIEKIINSNKKIILTINSIYFEVDNVTGEIIEYPFEKLDNYQSYDKITHGNDCIIIITTNSKNILTNKKILEELLQGI